MQTVVVVWALKRVQNSRSSWSLGCYMNLCYISHLKNGVQRQAGYVLIRKENEWKTADSWKYQQLGVVNILFGYTLLRLINNDQKSTDRVIYLIATCFDAIFTRWLMLLIKYSQRNETQTSPTAISDGLPTSDLIFAQDVQTNHNSAEPAKQPIRWGERRTGDIPSRRNFLSNFYNFIERITTTTSGRCEYNGCQLVCCLIFISQKWGRYQGLPTIDVSGSSEWKIVLCYCR